MTTSIEMLYRAGAAPDAPTWFARTEGGGLLPALTSLRGGFAVAWLDDSGRSVAAVDRMGIQTLCYRRDGDRLLVAERADDLAGPTPTLDPQALYDYLYFHVIPSPRTVFSGVHRLPPGHCVVLEAGELRVQTYVVPTFTEPKRTTLADAKQEFNELLRQAVRRQLDGGKPACFLSGGTDSSTVAGILTEVAGQPAETFSIGFEAEGYDEMAFARTAAAHFGCNHHEYYVTPDDLVREIGRVAAAYDQPFGNSSVLPTYHCALQARDQGVTRLLAGDGGDELFGGNTRYAMQELFAPYHRLPGVLRRGLLEPFFRLGAVARTPFLKKGSGYIRQANTPLPARLQTFNLLRRLGPAEMLTPAFLDLTNADSVAEQQQQVWDLADCKEELNRHLAYDWRYTLAENDLPKVRGATALAGVTVGFPMLDDDLLAFSMRLPVSFKLKGMTLRWFFKEALRGFLPDQVIAKKKQGFGLPFGVWAMRHPALRQLAADSVASFATRGILKPDFARQLMEQHLPAHPHYYGTMVWIVMMLEKWLQAHAPEFRMK